jgi:hypothetical protein
MVKLTSTSMAVFDTDHEDASVVTATAAGSRIGLSHSKYVESMLKRFAC